MTLTAYKKTIPFFIVFLIFTISPISAKISAKRSISSNADIPFVFAARFPSKNTHRYNEKATIIASSNKYQVPSIIAPQKPKKNRILINKNNINLNRFALIIGNADYLNGGSLKNPINDVRAIAMTLEGLNFEVTKHENIGQKAMKKAIDDFGKSLKNDSISLFFYAGHGVQIRGENYLIPVDANPNSENEVEYDGVKVSRVLGRMEESGSKIKIVILDACRDNPWERSWKRGVKGSGLAFTNAPSGTLIAYATSPGSTAYDGRDENGLYTSALLKYLKTPNFTLLEVFQNVRKTVMQESDNKQIPWESTSLTGNFYFNQE